MDARKSPKADLEVKKGIFFEIGLALALTMVVLAFQLKTKDKSVKEFTASGNFKVVEEIVPITEQDKPLPKPPATITAPVIRVVEDDVEVDDFIRIDAEANEGTEVEEYIPPTEILGFEDEESQGTEIFYVVESMPEFPGGEEALYQYLAENLHYPALAKEANVTGRVFLTFVVEKDGSVTDIRVLRGIGGGCDEEAVRVVQNMPRWVPGKQRGQPVRVQFNLPIRFTLQ